MQVGGGDLGGKRSKTLRSQVPAPCRRVAGEGGLNCYPTDRDASPLAEPDASRAVWRAFAEANPRAGDED